MRKLMLPVAAVLAWSVALAALSGFDAMDRGPEGMVAAAEMDVAEAKVTGEPAPPEEKD
jgi:hypothetical protein